MPRSNEARGCFHVIYKINPRTLRVAFYLLGLERKKLFGEMDRSFKNNADFKMNQQNFKLSDFGIDVKPGHEPKTAGQVRRGVQVSQRYVHAEHAHVRQIPMSPGRLATGSNLLQLACGHARVSCPLMMSNQLGNGPSQLGQLRHAAATTTDRFQTSSPSNPPGTGICPILQLSSSPSYWKQYGGQESGVNITRGIERSLSYRGNASSRSPLKCREQCDKWRDFATRLSSRFIRTD